MNRHRQLWVLAGGNGAGKSAFYRLFLKPRGITLVNADDIARALRPDDPEAASYAAAADAEILRGRLLESGASFCYETVFSHPSKIDFVARARELGYRVILAFFHLGDTALNLARISQRVAAGGHDVPEDKVRARLPRTLANVRAALPLCDEVILVDNSSADDPFRVVTRIDGGAVRADRAQTPAWALSLIDAPDPIPKTAKPLSGIRRRRRS